MKLLFDQNVSFKICRYIEDVFPGSTQVRLLGLDRADDRTIWDYAQANGFTLVSHDADFAEMAVLFGPPPKVVWLRVGNCSTSMLINLLHRSCNLISDFGDAPTIACLELYDSR
jgi:predicted nuclease of predicted toxin-antitoxin system